MAVGARVSMSMLTPVAGDGRSATSLQPTLTTSVSPASTWSRQKRSCGSSVSLGRSASVDSSTDVLRHASRPPTPRLTSAAFTQCATSGTARGGLRKDSYPLHAASLPPWSSQNLLSSDESPSSQTRSRGRSAACATSRSDVVWPWYSP